MVIQIKNNYHKIIYIFLFNVSRPDEAFKNEQMYTLKRIFTVSVCHSVYLRIKNYIIRIMPSTTVQQ